MVDGPNVADGGVVGEAPLVGGPAPVPDSGRAANIRSPASLIAARMIEAAERKGGLTVLLTTGEARADEIARAMGGMAAADTEVLVLPPWDCLPYDRASPSRESQGRRLAVLRRIAAGGGRQILIASPEAVMQRAPPEAAWSAVFHLTAGELLDREALAAFARQAGYVVDDRIDEPGEIAILGEVVDVFPAAAAQPARLTLVDDRIEAIRWFDPLSQRTEAEVIDALALGAASERLTAVDEEREQGCEHRLAEAAGPLESLFDRIGGADVWLDGDVEAKCSRFEGQVRDAYATARTFASDEKPAQPSGLYLTLDDLRPVFDSGRKFETDEATASPIFSAERRPGKALKTYIDGRLLLGRTVVVSAAEAELRAISRLLKRQGVEEPPKPVQWSDVSSVGAGAVVFHVGDPGVGFDDAGSGVTVLTATDIFGGRVAHARASTHSLVGEPELRVGDVVIHEEHGLGVLQALERVEIDGLARDVLRLEYHGGATVLAPVEELGRIWRYGSEPSAVTLDRLNSDSWLRRRADVSRQIDETATRLVAMVAEKAEAETPPIAPPRPRYAAFAAAFAFPESPDQAAAIEAVLEDLAAGRPMNRLVCGDVGFGKTEVALRAAAAVALSGRQVVVAAPTTVLARQHFETFARRFRDFDVEVAHLSRLVDSGETRDVQAGLADGRIQIVVGTQAVAAESLAFADLGLVIIDEEQRFGSKMKDALRARAPHALTLTATPIPRTLQSALVGLTDVSVIASPPARRRPIRTTLTGFDPASFRMALLREKRRGGQTFVVCPRIEDLEPMRARLAELTPELAVVTAHGKMPVAEIDQAMVGFAEGRGDVLLATNIVESGLDVPRANTIVVWRPDRFGLAQLHQLRGRVGRGRAQGFAYLLTETDDDVSEATRARLGTLEAFDRLGSGFAISARDLDLRGGGDLVGDEQAGHMKLIGSALYQRLLERAVRVARGEDVTPDVSPPRVTRQAYLPDDYIPDATQRINLYARLARITSASEVEALEDEVADRFGPLPEQTLALMAATRLSALAAEAGVLKIASGPKATAFTLSSARAKALRRRSSGVEAGRWVEDRLVFDLTDDASHDDRFIEAVLSDLAA